MAKQPRIYNDTKKCWLKRSQVERGIANKVYAWVKVNEVIRMLSVAETYAARKAEPAAPETLEYSEVAGLKVQGIPVDFGAIRASHEFYSLATA